MTPFIITMQTVIVILNNNRKWTALHVDSLIVYPNPKNEKSNILSQYFSHRESVHIPSSLHSSNGLNNGTLLICG